MPRGNTDGNQAISPLRYPGSKRQLTSYVRALIAAQKVPIDRFIEPFAGGASVALQLAHTDAVERVILADRDELIASFWQTAAFDTQWLIDAMWEVDVTLEKWEHFRESTPTTRRDQALTCLFLNRTSYSGILHSRAGPIGGKAQTSNYKIDCRFSKPTIQRRLSLVGSLAESGKLEAVLNKDWRETVSEVCVRVGGGAAGVLFYLDPPFYAKASELYRYSFGPSDHVALASFLKTFRYNWLLSYDDHPEVRALYESHAPANDGLFVVAAEYRAAASSRTASELIVSNLPITVQPQEAT